MSTRWQTARVCEVEGARQRSAETTLSNAGEPGPELQRLSHCVHSTNAHMIFFRAQVRKTNGTEDKIARFHNSGHIAQWSLAETARCT